MNRKNLEDEDEKFAILKWWAKHKLRVPLGGGRVHIDRSDFLEWVTGFQGAYWEWYMISRWKAVILSRSFFGETASEIGRVRDAYFITGCVRVDLSSS